MNDILNYSNLSINLTKKISKIEKKKNGIYFTPPQTIIKNIEFLKPYFHLIKNILEPSCGSCEFISKLKENFPNINITGLELNQTIFDSISGFSDDYISIQNTNYLNYNSSIKYDLIIGNPPYFVMKKGDIDKKYYDYFDGRPNIFIIFIIKSLLLLNDNGILSFVLPKSFLNCLYYDKTRKYINQHYQILNILECNDDYLETQQETIVIIIQKTKKTDLSNKKYCLNIGNYTIFGDPKNIIRLQLLYNNSSTLTNMGFTVSVGNIVWNQCKKDLSDDKDKTLLIYSSDIKNHQLVVQKYNNKEKKNYINKSGKKDPLLVINRGYGNGKYIFNYCIINENDDIEYLVENHLICIRYRNCINISKNELINLYKKIIVSFRNDKTHNFIQLYFSNNAINTTELCNILPIYDI